MARERIASDLSLYAERDADQGYLFVGVEVNGTMVDLSAQKLPEIEARMQEAKQASASAAAAKPQPAPAPEPAPAPTPEPAEATPAAPAHEVAPPGPEGVQTPAEPAPAQPEPSA